MISKNLETILAKITTLTILITIISKKNVNFGEKISNKLLDKTENFSYGNLKWLENL
jgi:hypothetical protein